MASGPAGTAALVLASVAVAVAAGVGGGQLWRAIAVSPARAGAMPSPPAASVPPPPAPIAAVDPRLLEPAPDWPGRSLPRIGGSDAAPVLPLARYAAAAPPVPAGRNRMAVVLDGLGLDHRMSLEAARALPAPVGFAFSPYAIDVGALLDAARAAGHELLASIPMAPDGGPLDDEGDMQLVPGGDPTANLRRLDWAVSAIAGAVGATGAESGQSGGRVNADRATIEAVGASLAARGLLYVDPVPDDAPVGPARQVDAALVLEPDAAGDRLDRELAQAEAAANRDGGALVIAGPPSGALVARLAAWCRALPARGIVLVPASALATAPDDAPNRSPVVTVPDDPRALAAALGDAPDRGAAR